MDDSDDTQIVTDKIFSLYSSQHITAFCLNHSYMMVNFISKAHKWIRV